MLNENNLPQELVNILIEKKLKIATAESCTGGLISKKITDIPGSSNVFECGICSYSDKIKEKILNVDNKTLEKYTAVSPQVAEQMAFGARKLSGADIAVSTTGFAGPTTGHSNEKVGLVFIGISCEKFNKVIELNILHKTNNSRDLIRQTAADKAIFETINIIKEWI